jgi:hypothetical protein
MSECSSRSVNPHILIAQSKLGKRPKAIKDVIPNTREARVRNLLSHSLLRSLMTDEQSSAALLRSRNHQLYESIALENHFKIGRHPSSRDHVL